MKKIIFILGFILPLPVYFNDRAAGFVQGLGGNLWFLFYDFGVILYPVYISLFILPLFLVISLVVLKFRPELRLKTTFLGLLYGFLASSGIFLALSFIAISQFKFAQ